MKKLICVLTVILFVPFVAHTQDRDLKNLFEKYKNVSGFELEIEDPGVDIDLDGDFDFLHFLDKVEKLYILNFDGDNRASHDFEKFSRRLDKMIDRKEFKSVFDLSGDGSVRILMKKNNDQITDVLMITKDGNEAMFFWASGK